MANLKIDLEQDEVFVFTPKGQVITLPVGADADRLRLHHPHRGRPRLHRGPGQRPARAARLDARRRATRSRSSRRRSKGAGPSQDWLKFVATHRAGNKIRQWFSRERREDAIETGADELIKALRREGLPVQKIQQARSLDEVADDAELRRPRRARTRPSARTTSRPSRSPRASQARSRTSTRPARSSCRPRSASRAGAGARQAGHRGRARRGPRRRHGPAVALLHARCPATRSWASSPGAAACRCTAPTAPTRCRCRRARATGSSTSSGTRTAPASFVASIEVKALDRARLLRDVSAALADHHVNISRCNTDTGSDRISKMRFDFELGDPGHLDSLISTDQADRPRLRRLPRAARQGRLSEVDGALLDRVAPDQRCADPPEGLSDGRGSGGATPACPAPRPGRRA